MNIEMLATILVISLIASIIARAISGFTLAGLLASYILACAGAVGGWLAQQRLRLPALYTFPFPGDGMPVPIVWPALAALLAALLGGRLWRPAPPTRRSR